MSASTPSERAGTDLPSAHQPYVPDHVLLPEFTWPAVLVGAVLGIVFGASSLYLVLKVGMTVSASIPVAVLSITLFRVFSSAFGVRRATHFGKQHRADNRLGRRVDRLRRRRDHAGPDDPRIRDGNHAGHGRSVLGGLLGILMMIPLRRAFIVKQHGKLIYPEGTACAEVLIMGETGGSTAKTVFSASASHSFTSSFDSCGLKLWKDDASRRWIGSRGPRLPWRPTPALLGVGYIIGTKISCMMVAGGIFSAFVSCR